MSDSDATIEPVEEETEMVVDTPKPKRKYTRKTVAEKAEEQVEIKKAVLVKDRKTKPIKEKVIYIVQDEISGEIQEVQRPAKKLSRKEEKKLEIEREAVQKEVEAGKRLTRKANGDVDCRAKPERSAKQKEATQKMIEANKQRRLRLKEQQDINTKETVKTSVKDAMTEIVKDPTVLKQTTKVNNKYQQMKNYL